MSTIRVTGPKGTFEVDESKRALYATNGYRAAADTALAPYQAAGAADAATTRADAADPLGSEANRIGGFARAILPTAAAVTAGSLVPEIGIPAWLARAGAGGLASGATDAGVQTLRGQRPDFSSVTRGAWDAGGEAIGGLIDALRSALGQGAMSSALRVGKGNARGAVDMASSLAGKPVPYHEADLAKQAIKERIAPGPPIFPSMSPREGTGSLKLADKMAAPMERRTEILQGASKAGAKATRQDFTQFIPDLRSELARGPNGTANVTRMEKLLDDFIDQGRSKPGAPLKGNPMKKLAPADWEQLKEEWQNFAQSAYGKQTGEKGAVADKFAKSIAAGIQDRIEKLTPSAVPGGIGEIESLNRRYRSLLPLKESVAAAELPRADIGGGFEKMNPLRLIPSNAKGRAALALTGGPAKFTAQQGPELAQAFARILALGDGQH